MRNVNWDNVSEATSLPGPEPGGYIIKIVRVEDVEEKEYLRIEYDFAEGDLKNYHKKMWEQFHNFWGGVFNRSYKEKALPFFKAFKTAVETSNPGFVFNNDPASLVGKYLGIVLAEEEYRSPSTGEIKRRLYVDQCRSGQAIRAGDYKVPDLKRLKKSEAEVASSAGAFMDLADDDGELPF